MDESAEGESSTPYSNVAGHETIRECRGRAHLSWRSLRSTRHKGELLDIRHRLEPTPHWHSQRECCCPVDFADLRRDLLAALVVLVNPVPREIAGGDRGDPRCPSRRDAKRRQVGDCKGRRLLPQELDFGLDGGRESGMNAGLARSSRTSRWRRRAARHRHFTEDSSTARSACLDHQGADVGFSKSTDGKQA